MSLFRFHSVHAALDWHMTGLGFLQWFDHLIDLENKRHFGVTGQEPACRTSIPVSCNLSWKQTRKLFQSSHGNHLGSAKWKFYRKNSLFSGAALRLLEQLSSQSKLCVYGLPKNEEHRGRELPNPPAWIPFPAIPAASGADGALLPSVSHMIWFLCLFPPGRNHLSVSALTEPPVSLNSTCSHCPQTQNKALGMFPTGERCFYLSSWEFFPDLLLFLASRGDERIFLDGGPESLP